MSSIIKVQNIQYTDGDAALTIADGGGVTAVNGLTSTGAAVFNGSVSGTAMTLLNSLTVSSPVANVTYTSSLITDDYMDYRITYRAVTPSSNGQKFWVYCSIDNGSNYNLPTEQHLMYHDTKASKAFGMAGTDNSAQRFDLNSSIGSASNKGNNGTIEFQGLRQTSTEYKSAFWNSVAGISSDSGHDGGNDYWWNGGGKIFTSSKINNIKIQMQSGTIAKGIFSLYGIKS